MNNAEQPETITVEDLKLIAETQFAGCHAYIFLHLNGAKEIFVDGGVQTYNPLTNDAQAWQLMQWYREALFNKDGIYSDSAWIYEQLCDATLSNRALVLAVLEFIKEK